MSWDAETYVRVDRMLFDLDDVLRRMMGWSRGAHLPHATDLALRQAWDLGLDAARVLHEEKKRLEQAKVTYDGEHRPPRSDAAGPSDQAGSG